MNNIKKYTNIFPFTRSLRKNMSDGVWKCFSINIIFLGWQQQQQTQKKNKESSYHLRISFRCACINSPSKVFFVLECEGEIEREKKLKMITRPDDVHLFIYDFNIKTAIFSWFFFRVEFGSICALGDGDAKREKVRLWWCVGIHAKSAHFCAKNHVISTRLINSFLRVGREEKQIKCW